MTRTRLLQLLLLLCAVVFIVSACGKDNNDQPQDNSSQPDNENGVTLTGVELVDTRCDQCHTQDRIIRDRSDEEWQEHALRMLAKSPDMLTKEEYDLVLEYLQEEY